jgi:hypothetical protein
MKMTQYIMKEKSFCKKRTKYDESWLGLWKSKIVWECAENCI